MKKLSSQQKPQRQFHPQEKQLAELFKQIQRAVQPGSSQRRKQQEQDVLQLLKKSAPIQEQGGIWAEVLIWAIGRQSIPIIQALVDLGIDVNIPYGTVLALNLNSHYKSLKVASLLIKSGADATRKGGWGDNALHCACEQSTSKTRSKDIKLFDLFIDSNCPINEQSNASFTPIECLISPYRGDMTRHFDYLIERGASLDNLVYRGANTVRDAVTADQPKIVERLLTHGAAIAIIPEGFADSIAIEKLMATAQSHSPKSLRALSKADLTGKNRPFVVPKTRMSKLLEPLQGVWRPDLPAPKKVDRILPPEFVKMWVDPTYSGFGWPNRYTVEKWQEDVERFSSVRLEVTGNVLEYRYPIGRHFAWIRNPKRAAFGISFDLDLCGRGKIRYEFSVSNDEMRIFGTAPVMCDRQLIWRR